MTLDPDRLQTAVAALAGGACWGLFHLATTLLNGQPVGRSDVLRAVANVIFGMIVGALAGYFVAPSLADLIPFASMRDPHVAGFAMGAGAWISWPFLQSWLGAVLGRKVRDAGQ